MKRRVPATVTGAIDQFRETLAPLRAWIEEQQGTEPSWKEVDDHVSELARWFDVILRAIDRSWDRDPKNLRKAFIAAERDNKLPTIPWLAKLAIVNELLVRDMTRLAEQQEAKLFKAGARKRKTKAAAA